MPKGTAPTAPRKAKAAPAPPVEEIEEDEEEESTESEEELDDEDEDDTEDEEATGIFEDEDDDEDLSGLAGANGKADSGSFMNAKGKKKISLNMKGASAGGAVIPAGTYYGRCTDVSLGKSKTSGKDRLEWSFIITAGAQKNATCKTWTSVEGDARWSTIRTLEAFGLQASDIEDFDLDPDDVIGKPVILTIEEDEYNGRPSHRVKEVGRPDKAAIAANAKATDLI